MRAPVPARGNFSGRSAVTFLLVGGAATALHYALMFAAVALAGVPVVWASAFGFAVGAVANYLLNARLTFRSDQPHASTAPRFFLTAGIGLCINHVVLSILVSNGLHAIPAQLLTTFGVLIWNYCINGLWTFANRPA
jgi:putative flippase GtrA